MDRGHQVWRHGAGHLRIQVHQCEHFLNFQSLPLQASSDQGHARSDHVVQIAFVHGRG